MTIDLLCQEMRDACWDRSELLGSLILIVAANKPVSHRGPATTAMERVVVRGKKGKKDCERQELLSLSGPVWILLFRFCYI